uniref:Uncharacterized protein n=1 Tax=Gadus morhua TaxID=8049 RepID=A0A8C5FSN5_GADMO
MTQYDNSYIKCAQSKSTLVLPCGNSVWLLSVLFGSDACDGPQTVVLPEGEVVEQDPLRQPQLGGPGSVSRQGVYLGHVFIGQDQVVPRAVCLLGHLDIDR